MKSIFKIFALMTIGIVSAFNLNAQSFDADEQAAIEALKHKPMNGLFGVSFTNSVPQNEFYDNMKRSGPGFSVYGGYTFAPVPVTIGLQGDFLFYGGDEKYFKYQNPGGWDYARDTVSYQNMVIPVTASVMFRPDVYGLVFPYFEVFGGFTMMSASADYKSSWGAEDDKSEFTASWNYGIGAGTMIKLVDFITLPEFRTRMLLDIKARYMKGTSTEYYMVKQINQDSSPDFRKSTSKTDMLTFQVGIVFEF